MHSETLATFRVDSLLRKNFETIEVKHNISDLFIQAVFQKKKKEIDIERAVKVITLARVGVICPYPGQGRERYRPWLAYP